MHAAEGGVGLLHGDKQGGRVTVYSSIRRQGYCVQINEESGLLYTAGSRTQA